MKRVRVRRVVTFEGARCVLLMYTDGSSMIRVDHPSNDPLIESSIGGMLVTLLRQAYEEAAVPLPVVGPIQWHDDPDGTPPPRRYTRRNRVPA